MDLHKTGFVQITWHYSYDITSLFDMHNVDVIYLDFYKSLELVIYNISVQKLEWYKNNMTHFKSMKNWYSDRSQCLTSNKELSPPVVISLVVSKYWSLTIDYLEFVLSVVTICFLSCHWKRLLNDDTYLGEAVNNEDDRSLIQR